MLRLDRDLSGVSACPVEWRIQPADEEFLDCRSLEQWKFRNSQTQIVNTLKRVFRWANSDMIPRLGLHRRRKTRILKRCCPRCVVLLDCNGKNCRPAFHQSRNICTSSGLESHDVLLDCNGKNCRPANHPRRNKHRAFETSFCCYKVSKIWRLPVQTVAGVILSGVFTAS